MPCPPDLFARVAECDAQLCALQADAWRGVCLLLDAQPAPDERARAALVARLHREFAACIEQCVAQAQDRLTALIDAALAAAPTDPAAMAFLQQEAEQIDAACRQFQQALRQARADMAAGDSSGN
ncbi:MAG: hypothetical protein WBG17_09015 [Burkholderiaceae bacterium]